MVLSKIRYSLMGVVGVVMAFLSFAALANERITVAAVPNYPPYSFVDEAGELRGMDVDVAKEAARRIAIELNFTTIPFKRILHHLESGEIDAGLPGFSRDYRRVFADYPTEPLRKTAFHIFSLKRNPFDYEGIDSLSMKRLSVPLGWSISTELDAAIEAGRISVENAVSSENMVKQLLAGRLDIIINRLPTVLYHADQLKKAYEIYVSSREYSAGEGSYILFSKKGLGLKSAEMAEAFSSALKDMRRDGSLMKIADRYLMKVD